MVEGPSPFPTRFVPRAVPRPITATRARVRTPMLRQSPGTIGVRLPEEGQEAQARTWRLRCGVGSLGLRRSAQQVRARSRRQGTCRRRSGHAVCRRARCSSRAPGAGTGRRLGGREHLLGRRHPHPTGHGVALLREQCSNAARTRRTLLTVQESPMRPMRQIFPWRSPNPPPISRL